MKPQFMALLALSFGSPAFATEADRHEYFYGEAHVINLNGGLERDQHPPLLLKKSTLPSQNLLVERATTPDERGQMKDRIVYMKVSGETLSISDADDSIEGQGQVAGVPWHWNLLRFSMVAKRGKIRIEDVNYRTPDRLIARKTLFLPNGKPFMLWDVDAQEISAAEYEKRYADMHATGSKP